MSVKDLMRNELKEFAAYNAGVHLVGVDFRKIVKLNANESMMGPSQKAMDAMAEELKYGYMYPQPVIAELSKELSDFLGKPEDNIVVMNGSGSGIQMVGECFLNPGDEMLLCDPTFMAYYKVPARFGAILKTVTPKDGVSQDLDLLYDAITEKTKLIVLCNPNNPTGTLIDHEKLKEFIEKLPKHVVVIMDEAYIEWVDIPGYQSALDLVTDDNNIIILRTFSKNHGMAGYRIGYSVANKALTECLNSLTNYYSPNRIAARGAAVSLHDKEWGELVYKNNKEQRDYMQSEMAKMGMLVTPSQASFIWFDPKCDSKVLFDKLIEKKVYIRPFHPYLRVSIGLPEQNQAFLDALAESLKEMNLEEKKYA